MTSYRIPCDVTDIFQWKFHLHFIRGDKIHWVPLTTSKKAAKETARYKWVLVVTDLFDISVNDSVAKKSAR